MTKAHLSWFLSSLISLLLFSMSKNTVLVEGKCLNDQRSLLHFNNSVEIYFKNTNIGQWNLEEDCCSWRGVGCDAAGRVTTLELNDQSITGGAESLTILFKLQFLEKLHLANNDFVDKDSVSRIPIPKEIANLANLLDLDLSNCGFGGQIPMGFSSLRKLVSLNLAYNDRISMELETLSSIHNLSAIRLDGNNISTVPEFFASMPNLRTLSLSHCNLVGQFPVKIFQVPTLQILDVSYNEFLQGSLPPFPENSSLRSLSLRYTNFSGSLPNSIGILHMLSSIDLRSCGFSGTIPAALAGLPKLSYVDLANNKFSGPFPQFQLSNDLVYIDISYNSLTGSISNFKGLQSLETLNLENNFLSGRVPSFLFQLPSVTSIDLSNNQFSGQIDDIPVGLSISQRLVHLDLSSNRFNGSFPKFIFESKELEEINLSSNSFTDTIQLETFKNLPNLTGLDLSHNNLSVELQNYNSSLPRIQTLRLVSCKLKEFPEMKNNTDLIDFDLSDNEITGEIPNWIWNPMYLGYVNLSLNSFVGLQQPYNINSVDTLDLHSNQLKGELPSVSVEYLDLSKNNFSGPIPLELYSARFMSLSENSLTGSIPNSICLGFLEFLDLSNNFLIGPIPSCLMNNRIQGMNLAGNNLNGNISDTFPADCVLKTLELGENNLQGKLPRSLSSCTKLQVLNLGHNEIEDVFPCMFENLSFLSVLILRSNKFHGEVECFGYNYSWPRLQIVDIASNNFSGVLSSHFFSSLKNLLTMDFTQESSNAGYASIMVTGNSEYNYQFKVELTMKGREIELQKILTIYTTINLSNNKFSGNIPESVGDLKGLYILDLSHNKITGRIPSSIGKLSNLGSLELSRNQLTGEIPSSVQDLIFLTYLNLSFNMLIGKIPTGPQLQTFSNDSYIGNVELCGFPLSVSCGDANDTGSSGMPMLSNKKEINWMYICASLGYTVGLGIFSMLLLFCERWRNKFFLQVDQVLVKMFGPVWREPIRRL